MDQFHRLPDCGYHRCRVVRIRFAWPAGHRRRTLKARQGIFKDGDGFAWQGLADRYGATHRLRAAFHERCITDQDEWRDAPLFARKPSVDGDVRPDAGRLAERQCQGKRRFARRRLRRAHLYSITALARKSRRKPRAIREPRSLESLSRTSSAAMDWPARPRLAHTPRS